jgi:hypothetical protein
LDISNYFCYTAFVIISRGILKYRMMQNINSALDDVGCHGGRIDQPTTAGGDRCACYANQ